MDRSLGTPSDWLRSKNANNCCGIIITYDVLANDRKVTANFSSLPNYSIGQVQQFRQIFNNLISAWSLYSFISFKMIVISDGPRNYLFKDIRERLQNQNYTNCPKDTPNIIKPFLSKKIKW